MDIAMEVVSSSAVNEIGYDTQTRTLRVEWRDGKIQDYDGITPEQYAQCRKGSIGSWLNRNVKRY